MIDGKVAVAVVGCGGMGGGHAVAIATGSGQALWMTDGSKAEFKKQVVEAVIQDGLSYQE